ncbi:MAG TPA: ACT domain-containing protein [Bacillota bacterium]
MEKRRAVVSVVGKDKVGIIAKVTMTLAENDINILDISQTILDDFFTMIMIVDVSKQDKLDHVRNELDEVGDALGLKITVQLEEIFQAMHRV